MKTTHNIQDEDLDGDYDANQYYKDQDDDEYEEEDEGEHGDDQEDIAHLTVIAIESIVGAPA